MATDDEIVTYTGHDLEITDKNWNSNISQYSNFSNQFCWKIAFLDNVIGLYEYKYWSNGKKSGIIWEWKQLNNIKFIPLFNNSNSFLL